jgi:hypothetical protein
MCWNCLSVISTSVISRYGSGIFTTSTKNSVILATDKKIYRISYISNKLIFIIIIVISMMYNLDGDILHERIFISRINKNERMNECTYMHYFRGLPYWKVLEPS